MPHDLFIFPTIICSRLRSILLLMLTSISGIVVVLVAVVSVAGVVVIAPALLEAPLGLVGALIVF